MCTPLTSTHAGYIWTDYGGTNHSCPPDCGGDESSSGSSGSSSSNADSGWNSGPTADEMNAQQAADINARCNESFSRKEYDAAIECYQQALWVNPDSLIIQGNLKRARSRRANALGIKAYEAGDWETAVSYYREALTYDDDENLRANLADALEQLNNSRKVQSLDESKTKINSALDNVVAAFDNTDSEEGSNPSVSSGLAFMDKKTAPPAATGLEFMNGVKINGTTPANLKDTPSPKGLKIKDVPSPIVRHQPADFYSEKTRDEIILDSIKRNGIDLDKTVQFLEGYLKDVNPGDTRVQTALSHIEGMRAGLTALEDGTPRKPPVAKTGKTSVAPEPGSNDNYQLLESAANCSPRSRDFKVDHRWPGPKNPDPNTVPPDPAYLSWKADRREAIFEATERGKGDWNKSLDYLRQRVKTNEQDQGAQTALSYLEGFYAYVSQAEKAGKAGKGKNP